MQRFNKFSVAEYFSVEKIEVPKRLDVVLNNAIMGRSYGSDYMLYQNNLLIFLL